MAKKIFAFDVETTGLDPKRHAIIQLAAMMIIDGKKVDTINILMAPHEGALIDRQSLSVHGYTEEQIRSFPSSLSGYMKLSSFLVTHIDRFDRNDKAYPFAFNGQFDIGFLSEFFQLNGDPYLGSFINWKLLDPLPLLRMLEYVGLFPLPRENMKLETLARHFCIDIKAHDAVSDVEAALAVWERALDLVLKFGRHLHCQTPGCDNVVAWGFCSECALGRKAVVFNVEPDKPQGCNGCISEGKPDICTAKDCGPLNGFPGYRKKVDKIEMSELLSLLNRYVEEYGKCCNICSRNPAKDRVLICPHGPAVLEGNVTSCASFTPDLEYIKELKGVEK